MLVTLPLSCLGPRARAGMQGFAYGVAPIQLPGVRAQAAALQVLAG